MILLKHQPELSPVQAAEERLTTVESFEARSYGVGHETDPISQLRANLSQVEDLVGRLRFVMGEVRTVIQKKV